jgi:long-chain acyl-CoA synthetase
MLVFSVPRVYEKMYARVQDAGNSGSPLKRALFQWCVAVGQQVSALQQHRQPVPARLRLRQWLAYQLVFKKLHQTVGGRLRYFISGGAPLAQEIAEFFHAAGILILEGYGLTETCPALTANCYDRYKFGTVGMALPGVELRIAPDGEILARGPNIAKGYYKRPEATAEVFLDDGWFATGDIGEMDAEGFLRITDRKKDVIVTAGGKNIAPQNLENLLKTDPYISQAMVYGERRPYLTAILTLDLDATRQYAQTHGITAETLPALTAHPQIQQLIEARMAKLNAQLASYETIKKFIIAPTDFTPEWRTDTDTESETEGGDTAISGTARSALRGRLACGRTRLNAWRVPHRRASGTSRPTHGFLRRSYACRNARCAARPSQFPLRA